VNTLKAIYLTVVQLLQQIGRFPQKTATAFAHWRQRGVRREKEAERLDRIRNPSKYHCK
jgi:hypothetical protein